MTTEDYTPASEEAKASEKFARRLNKAIDRYEAKTGNIVNRISISNSFDGYSREISIGVSRVVVQ